MPARYYDKRTPPSLSETIVAGAPIKVWTDGSSKPYTGTVARNGGKGLVTLQGTRGAQAVLVQNMNSGAIYLTRGVETTRLVASIEVG